jgi:hypothetical protein
MKYQSILKSTIALFLLKLIVIASVAVASESAPPDPEKWYLESYGPMWVDEPQTKVDEISRFYAEEIQEHEPDGEIVSLETVSWLAGLFELWQDEGWVSSELAELRVTRINASTTSFISRWVDHYENGEDDYSCGWYVADLMDGHWKFTNYTPIDCAEHGF